MAQKPSIPKGTRDFLPEVSLRREYIFDTIKAVFKKYGYAPIETPAMEQLSVLTGKYGEEGDRLIFKILNTGDYLAKADKNNWGNPKALSFQISKKALRYDLTVPFARFVVMNQNELVFPFKRYQVQPVWRADNPQKGRYREFYQCDADVVGSDSLLFEAEFVAMYDEALSNLGLNDFTIQLNHRKILSGYAEVIGQPDKVVEVCMAIDKLDKIGEAGVRKELMGRGIEGADQLFEIIGFEGNTEAKINFLKEKFADCEIGLEGVGEMEEVFSLYQYMPRFEGKVDFNLQLARGLDYYTGTVFEVKANNVKIGSICGGGRYADLTGVFGRPGLSGVGISFGADRIYVVMEELGLFKELGSSSTKVLLINFGEDVLPTNLAVLKALREAGVAAELYPDKAKLKKQFSFADRKQLPYTIVIGSDEQESGQYKLKNMASGEEQSLSLEEIIARLR
ncbi:MAG: histidine--tRNA ligase [Bacteroidota bacterium]